MTLREISAACGCLLFCAAGAFTIVGFLWEAWKAMRGGTP